MLNIRCFRHVLIWMYWLWRYFKTTQDFYNSKRASNGSHTDTSDSFSVVFRNPDFYISNINMGISKSLTYSRAKHILQL